jgi:hypothetical protein
VLELIAGVLLAVGAVSFVLRPIFRPDAARGDILGTGGGGLGDEGEDPEDDLSPRAVALRALKEIEFDRATGKLSDADYDMLKSKYTAEALAAFRRESVEREVSGVGSQVSGSAVLTPDTRHPTSDDVPRCPTHGPRAEADAQFCSECGHRLGTAPGYCARCGTALEHEARYCHACGARVAA